MGWNYRVMRYAGPGDETNYGIHEVYYDSDGKVKNWTTDSAGVISDDRSGLLLVLAQMAEALQQPVLDHATGDAVEPEQVLTDQLVSELRRVKAEVDDDLPPRRSDHLSSDAILTEDQTNAK